MLKLFRKDLLVIYRFHIMSVLVSIAAVSLLHLERNNYSFMGLYICLAGSFAYIVGQSCFLEDKGASGSWLRTLPIRVNQMVDAKYLLALFALFEGVLVYIGTQFILSKFLRVELQSVGELFPVIIGFHLFYCGLYLFLFFRYGFSIAKHSIMLMLVFLLFAKMVGSKKFIDLSNVPTTSVMYIF